MGFLDNLLWSSFAVGYPLLASVKALMENSDLRKLMSYWIIFSFFSLLELALAKFIQWIPFWTCIKLGTLCWLVLPQFEQAYSVYSRHIQPILMLINNYFSKSIERILSKEEIFLPIAEKFVKVNGSKAFEDLIARKLPHARKPNVVNEDLKLKLIMGACEAVGASLPHNTNDNRAQEVVVQASSSSKSIETRDIAKIPIMDYRGYYRCDICHLTMSNVSAFHSHIDGKRHQKALWAFKDGFQCSLCDVSCQNIASIQSHLKGSKHLDFASKLFVVNS